MSESVWKQVNTDDTVWRLTEEDFKAIIEQNHPELTEEQRNLIIDNAKRQFNINDWAEWVDEFITVSKEDL